MRRQSLFWGILVTIIGILFLMQSLNILEINAWKLVWPIGLIMIGLWVLFGRKIAQGEVETESLTIPVEQAQSGKVTFKHGAGRLNVSAGSNEDELLSGTFDNGIEQKMYRSGSQFDLELHPPADIFRNFPHTPGYNWDVKLNPNLDLNLKFESGANETLLDLRKLKVSALKISTGASSNVVKLPEAAGYTFVDIESGAASLTLEVPAQAAAKIQVSSGLSSINIPSNRFPATSSGYQSPDYDTNPNKFEIKIESGVGSINIE
jgi:hypothetical protein